jgi:hypothetical protein
MAWNCPIGFPKADEVPAHVPRKLTRDDYPFIMGMTTTEYPFQDHGYDDYLAARAPRKTHTLGAGYQVDG